MIIDMHIHTGRTRRTGDVDRVVLARMRRAGVAAPVVSVIGDILMIRRNRETGRLARFRDAEPGECLEAVEGYLTRFEQSGKRIAREPGDIVADERALRDRRLSQKKVGKMCSVKWLPVFRAVRA